MHDAAGLRSGGIGLLGNLGLELFQLRQVIGRFACLRITVDKQLVQKYPNADRKLNAHIARVVVQSGENVAAMLQMLDANTGRGHLIVGHGARQIEVFAILRQIEADIRRPGNTVV